MIYIGDGILNQIQNLYYYDSVITKEKVFNEFIRINKEFYERYPYSIKWDYEGFIRDILDYYD